MFSASNASQGIVTNSRVSPFSLRVFCLGLYDVLDRAGMYQDGDSLVECGLEGGPALTFVNIALELRPNPRRRRKYCGTDAGLVESLVQAMATLLPRL